jgi:hypothetical protein
MKVFLIKEFVNLCTEFVNLETGKSQLIGRNMSTQKQEKESNLLVGICQHILPVSLC